MPPCNIKTSSSSMPPLRTQSTSTWPKSLLQVCNAINHAILWARVPAECVIRVEYASVPSLQTGFPGNMIHVGAEQSFPTFHDYGME